MNMTKKQVERMLRMANSWGLQGRMIDGVTYTGLQSNYTLKRVPDSIIVKMIYQADQLDKKIAAANKSADPDTMGDVENTSIPDGSAQLPSNESAEAEGSGGVSLPKESALEVRSSEGAD